MQNLGEYDIPAVALIRVLQKKKQVKKGTYIWIWLVYFHLLFVFCILFLFNDSSQIISIYFTGYYCCAHPKWFGTMNVPQQTKKWYVSLCHVICHHFYVPATHPNLLLHLFLFIVVVVWNWAYFWFTYHCKWGRANYTSFFIVCDECDLFSLGSWQFAFCWMWTWVPLLLASYFDGFILLASYFDGCKFRR